MNYPKDKENDDHEVDHRREDTYSDMIIASERARCGAVGQSALVRRRYDAHLSDVDRRCRRLAVRPRYVITQPARTCGRRRASPGPR